MTDRLDRLERHIAELDRRLLDMEHRLSTMQRLIVSMGSRQREPGGGS